MDEEEEHDIDDELGEEGEHEMEEGEFSQEEG